MSPVFIARLTLGLAAFSMLGGCASRELELLSWNLLHGADERGNLNLAAKGEYVAARDADLVFLQEIDQSCRRSGSEDQMVRLAAATGLDPAFGAFMDFDGGQYGLGMLSGLPVLGTRSIPLPEGNEPRVALAREVQVLGRPLLAVCVHFNWIEDDAARFAQAQALLAELELSGLPCIVAGDFNDVPDSRTMRAFYAAGFTHAEAPGPSWNARAPSQDIDHLLIRSGPGLELRADGGAVLEETELSDHRPVWARVLCRRTR